MRVRHNGVGAGGDILHYIIRINGAATALDVPLASNAADGAELVASVVVAAGDLIDVECVKLGEIGGSPRDVMVSVELA